MPFTGGPDLTVPTAPAGADTPVPFNVALATADTAQDFATIPALKSGKTISLINLGPGSVFIKPDADATAVPASNIEVKKNEEYSETGLSVTTRWSFIGEAGKTPTIRGVVWAG